MTFIRFKDIKSAIAARIKEDLAADSKDGEQIPTCNCHMFDNQVCDICQRVSGSETDRKDRP